MPIQKTFTKRILPVMGGLFLSTLTLSGCELYDPVVETQVYPVKMRLQQNVRSQTFSADQKVDHELIHQTVEHYKKAGEGHVTLLLRFQEGNRHQANAATKAGAEYKRLLSQHGVKNAKVQMQPMPQYSKENAEIIMSYQAWKASAPLGCENQRIPGYFGADGPDTMHDYKIGCESETYISKMVSRPKDLAGNSGMTEGDSRREATVVEGYKSGVPNEPLEGLQASDLGGGG